MNSPELAGDFCFLSHPWGPACPAYGGGESVKIIPLKDINAGDSCNQLGFSANAHIGTHFDFPRHFDPNGKHCLDYPAVSFLHSNIAVCWLECTGPHLVGIQDLQNSLGPDVDRMQTTMILIRTGASKYRTSSEFWSNGPGIGVGVADFIRNEYPRVHCVGIDSISITSFQRREIGRQVHREFLANHQRPFTLIEDMDLEPLNGRTPAFVWAVPLRIQDSDGCPCTVIAQI